MSGLPPASSNGFGVAWDSGRIRSPRPAARIIAQCVMPAVFAEAVRQMKPGDVSNVLRSASGFHILKLAEARSRNAPTVVEQQRGRAIWWDKTPRELAEGRRMDQDRVPQPPYVYQTK